MSKNRGLNLPYLICRLFSGRGLLASFGSLDVVSFQLSIGFRASSKWTASCHGRFRLFVFVFYSTRSLPLSFFCRTVVSPQQASPALVQLFSAVTKTCSIANFRTRRLWLVYSSPVVFKVHQIYLSDAWPYLPALGDACLLLWVASPLFQLQYQLIFWLFTPQRPAVLILSQGLVLV